MPVRATGGCPAQSPGSPGHHRCPLTAKRRAAPSRRVESAQLRPGRSSPELATCNRLEMVKPAWRAEA